MDRVAIHLGSGVYISTFLHIDRGKDSLYLPGYALPTG